MKITPDRLAVARAVRKETMHAFVWSRAIRTAEEMLESLPEPPDDSPATLPAPTGPIIKALRNMQDEIVREGNNGWGNTIDMIIEALIAPPAKGGAE